MKKFFLSAFVVVSFIIYSLTQKGASSSILAPANVSDVSSNSVGPVSSAPVGAGSPNPPTSATPIPKASLSPAAKPKTTPAPAPTPTPAPVSKGIYTDGVYTGPSADAYYGNIQVQVTIANGKIADVKFLDYPRDRGTSREINSQAMPYLKQEAIAAQSASVNIISGATDSSLAFRQSLASALSHAKS